MSYAVKWNKIDSVIFFCESKVRELKQAIMDSSEAEPDMEEMLQAETEHLRNENEKLRKREIPLYLVEDGQHYFCPKCQIQVADPDTKYCSNCGQRVIKRVQFHMERTERLNTDEKDVCGTD